jgi:hypothetical protein
VDFARSNCGSGIVFLVLWACECICAPMYNYKHVPETWNLKDPESVRKQLLGNTSVFQSKDPESVRKKLLIGNISLIQAIPFRIIYNIPFHNI